MFIFLALKNPKRRIDERAGEKNRYRLIPIKTYSLPYYRQHLHVSIYQPTMNSNKITLYSTASLFNSRDLHFNICLNELLERQYGYKIYVPQRDGFEFANCELLSLLLEERSITGQENKAAIERIIYLLDMGHFIGKSHMVLANLDEPIDEGVVVEMQHARNLGKPVIGWRTDERNPYGSRTDPFKGCHFFPAMQCDVFLAFQYRGASTEGSCLNLQKLAENIHASIQDLLPRTESSVITTTPATKLILEQAEALFHDLDNIHTDESLSTIVSRYADLKSRGVLIGPKILHL